jgi:Mg2+-importing ATPase
MNFEKYLNLNSADALRSLDSQPKGLSEKESLRRRSVYGLNEIKEKGSVVFEILVRQIKSAFFFFLFAAGTVSLIIPGEKTSGILIFVFLSINLALGFFQEYRAVRSVKLLESYLSKKTRVLRNGKETEEDKANIVPGDIVLLERGNIVPADLRIIRSDNFSVDESVLTGESVPSAKTDGSAGKGPADIYHAANIAFGGTSVVSGKAEGLVIATGINAAYGEIEGIASKGKRQSLYEQNLASFSKRVLQIVIATIVIVFSINFFLHGTENAAEFSIFCIALLVGIIPEALPVVTIFALSEGALKLAKHKVVVKRLSAIENLGNIDILCTDKTGTITENKLSLEKVDSKDKEKCLLYGLLASAFAKENIESAKDPFDTALFRGAPESIRFSLKKFRPVSEISFSPERGSNSVLTESPGKENILIVRGACEKVILKCSILPGGETKESLLFYAASEGLKGRRVLAIAGKKLEKDHYTEKDESALEFLGYFIFSDPLKKTAKAAIESARLARVQVKILTGDSREVAEAVGREVGLLQPGERAVLGEEVDALSPEEMAEKCETCHVFARVLPRTKYNIIRCLQKGHEVGFLGEGINDVPSLKAADAAIAVQSAADVSKDAADIVLLGNDLKTAIEGVRCGRNVFANIQKYIKCTLASNFGNCYSMAIISLMIPYLPILPIQILLLNLLTDFPLIAIVFDSVDAEELRAPKNYQLSKTIPLIIVLGLVSSMFDFIFFWIFNGAGEANLQTLWFTASALTECALIFSIRTSRPFWKAKRPAPVLSFLAAITVAFAILLPFTGFGRKFLGFAAPQPSAIALIILLVLVYFILSEIAKNIYYRHRLKGHSGRKLSKNPAAF